jgi:hypothetical protein
MRSVFTSAVLLGCVRLKARQKKKRWRLLTNARISRPAGLVTPPAQLP